MITASFIPEAVQRPRVLLADDHPAMHARATDALAGGSLGNGCESLAEPERLHPDLIVLDISMPGLEGIEAARQLKRAGCPRDARFLAVQKDSGQGAYRTLAATAYVIKTCLSSDLVTAIFEALGEERFVLPTISLAKTHNSILAHRIFRKTKQTKRYETRNNQTAKLSMRARYRANRLPSHVPSTSS